MFHHTMATIALWSLTLGLNQHANARKPSVSADKDKSCVAQCRADFHGCMREGQREFFCRLEYALCFVGLDYYGEVIAELSPNEDPKTYGTETESQLSVSLVKSLRRRNR